MDTGCIHWKNETLSLETKTLIVSRRSLLRLDVHSDMRDGMEAHLQFSVGIWRVQGLGLRLRYQMSMGWMGVLAGYVVRGVDLWVAKSIARIRLGRELLDGL